LNYATDRESQGLDPDGLRRSFETANGACARISEQACHHETFRQLALDKLVYYQDRERFGFSAQQCGLSPERDVVQNRLSPSFRFRRLSAESQALAFSQG
jgi:hypothetical protein